MFNASKYTQSHSIIIPMQFQGTDCYIVLVSYSIWTMRKNNNFIILDKLDDSKSSYINVYQTKKKEL